MADPVWNDKGPPYTFPHGIDRFNVLFCDGSVRFIIDSAVYNYVSTYGFVGGNKYYCQGTGRSIERAAGNPSPSY